MIRVRLEQPQGVCKDLPRHIDVQGHAEPDRPRTGPGSREMGGQGAPVTAAHLAIAHSIARRVSRELVSVERSGRGVALHVVVGVPRYTREVTAPAGFSRGTFRETFRETTTRPRGRGWKRDGHETAGSVVAVIEAR